jgi:hypothetical protein
LGTTSKAKIGFETISIGSGTARIDTIAHNRRNQDAKTWGWKYR